MGTSNRDRPFDYGGVSGNGSVIVELRNEARQKQILDFDKGAKGTLLETYACWSLNDLHADPLRVKVKTLEWVKKAMGIETHYAIIERREFSLG